MARLFHRHSLDFWRKYSTFLLAFFFLAGIISGIGSFDSNISSSWMRGLPDSAVSIVRLILFTFFPFLISAFAVSMMMPGALLAVSFLKGMLFSYAALWISCCFGSAGWLFRLLLLFSDSFSLPLLYFFWLRHISGSVPLHVEEMVFYFAMISLICCVDFCLVTPFWARIIVF